MTKEEFIARIAGSKKAVIVFQYIEKCYEELKKISEEEQKLLRCCANCSYSMQGDYDEFENCGRCKCMFNICQNKASPYNKEQTDWGFSCSCWALREKEDASDD